MSWLENCWQNFRLVWLPTNDPTVPHDEEAGLTFTGSRSAQGYKLSRGQFGGARQTYKGSVPLRVSPSENLSSRSNATQVQMGR